MAGYPTDQRTGFPTTVRGWEAVRPAEKPRRAPVDTLASVLAKVRMGSPMSKPGDGMVPWAALPRMIRESASGALTTEQEAPIGFAPSDFDPEERAIFERLVAVGLKEQEPLKLRAEQEAEAKLQQDAAMAQRAGR